MSNVGKIIVYTDGGNGIILSVVLYEVDDQLWCLCPWREMGCCYTRINAHNYELFDDIEVARARLAPNETSEKR